jgi:thioredoxin 1
MKLLRLILAPIALAATVVSAQAAETRKFDQATFDAAKAQGRSVLVEVGAWWCPVCTSQKRSIAAITADPAYDRLLILKVSYDGQKTVWRGMGVQKQGTLIGYKGQREIGRLAFVTDRNQIAALLASTLR